MLHDDKLLAGVKPVPNGEFPSALLPLSRKQVCPPPLEPRGGGSNVCLRATARDDWRESLALCLLCEHEYVSVGVDICETPIKFSLKRNCFLFEDKKSFFIMDWFF
jgi:hypothetical protein